MYFLNIILVFLFVFCLGCVLSKKANDPISNKAVGTEFIDVGEEQSMFLISKRSGCIDKSYFIGDVPFPRFECGSKIKNLVKVPLSCVVKSGNGYSVYKYKNIKLDASIEVIGDENKKIFVDKKSSVSDTEGIIEFEFFSNEPVKIEQITLFKKK